MNNEEKKQFLEFRFGPIEVKRFARYASTQAAADKASVDARGGAAAS